MPSLNKALPLVLMSGLMVVLAGCPSPTKPTGDAEGTPRTPRGSKAPVPTPTASVRKDLSETGDGTGGGPSPVPSASTTVVVPSQPPVGPADFFGQVIGLDGQPAANVKVRGFLAAGAGTSAYRARRVLQTATLETTTDAQGKFKLVDPAGKPLNLEAALSDTVKAFEFNVASTALGLKMQLATVGEIKGVIKIPGVTDFSGVTVSIPGTPYTATTDAAGNYSLPQVPPGSFSLQAVKAGAGTVNIPGITVVSNSPATVTERTLAASAPEITAIAPLNAGPGATVTITGKDFPAGATYTVAFVGTPATNVVRVNATTLTATVPVGAASGDVTVKIGDNASNAVAFKVMSILAIAPDTPAAKLLRVAATQQFTFTAQDSSGASVADPVATWSVVDGTAIEVSTTGLVTAKSAGTATLKVSSGTITGTLPITVQARFVVTTVAGTGAATSTDGPALGATFNKPTGVAVDPSTGTIFIADNNGNRIRTLMGGNVATIAGSATQSTADGTGDQAGFAFPMRITINPLRSALMVADQQNHRIRLVTPTGTVTTLAGGGPAGVGSIADALTNANGTDARFNAPTAAAMASDGTIYVADQFNHAIRKIDTSGNVTTLAGGSEGIDNGTGPAAKFAMPTDIAVHPTTGMIYVTDKENMVIRQITPAGVVTTLAGAMQGEGDTDGAAAVAKFSNPDGLALDATGRLYVSDLGNHRIRMIDLNSAAKTVSTITGSVMGFADGEDAKFNTPRGIAFDANGDLYVSDMDNHRIRKVDLTP